MARHRNYRNYSYEDDLSDDVYGHSVEDYDMAVSPTTAEQFMFRRSNSRDPNLSIYMADRFGRVDEEDEEESEEETLASSQDYKRPQLDPTSEAKLSSCMDQLHSILGETLHEPTAVTAVLQSNFDIERALDQILSQGGKQDLKANLNPVGKEGSVSCKTLTLTKDVHAKHAQYEKYRTQQSCNNNTPGFSKTESAVFVSDSQLSKSAVVSTLANISTKSSCSLARDGKLSHSVGTLSSQAVTSQPLHQLQVSSQKSLNAAPVSSVLQSGGALSSHTSTLQPLDLLKSSTQSHLLSVPLSSLSKSEGASSGQASASWSLDLLQTSKRENPLLLAPLSSFSLPGGPLSTTGATSQPLDLLQASTQNPPLSAPLTCGSLSVSGGALPGQAATTQPLDLLQALPQNPLLPAPLRSMSQSEGVLLSLASTLQPHGQLQASSQNHLLSVPLSSLTKSEGTLSSEAQGLLQTSPQTSLLFTPLSSLSVPAGCGQAATKQQLDLLQTSSQNSLLSVPLSSLTKSEGALSSEAQGLSQSSPQTSLLSIPLSNLSVPTGCGQVSTKQQLDLLQTSSENPLLSVPVSSLSIPGGSATATPQLLDVSQASSQTSLLSTPLSSLPQQVGPISSLVMTSQPLELSRASPQSSPLSVPLSSLTGQQETCSTSDHQNSLSLPLSNFSSLAGHPLTKSDSSNLLVPLSSLSLGSSQTPSSCLLAASLRSLSQTAQTMQSGSEQADYHDPIVSTQLPSRPILPQTKRPQTEDSVLEIDKRTYDGTTADVKLTTDKLDKVKIPGKSRTGKGKKDYNKNLKAEHKLSMSPEPLISSIVDPSLDQGKIMCKRVIKKKEISSMDQKRKAIGKRNDTCTLTAKPTFFALTICYSVPAKKTCDNAVTQRVIQELQNLDSLRIAAFNFSTPSPDDIVNKRQKGAFSRKK